MYTSKNYFDMDNKRRPSMNYRAEQPTPGGGTRLILTINQIIL